MLNIDDNGFLSAGFSEEKLSWKLRLEIAKGIAKGLAFLHRFRAPIFDWDIKASDILLDAVTSIFFACSFTKW